jgi:hypothetical protein
MKKGAKQEITKKSEEVEEYWECQEELSFKDARKKKKKKDFSFIAKTVGIFLLSQSFYFYLFLFILTFKTFPKICN